MNFVSPTMGRSAIFALAGAAFVWAQAPKEFEVASIKVHKDGDGRVDIHMSPGGMFRATNIPLGELIQMAYDLRPGMMVGAPKWIDSEHYDIEAKMAEPPPPGAGADPMRPYIQSLIEKRFQMKSHREMREMQSYALVQAKGGPKLKESAPEARGPMIQMGHDQITMTKAGMTHLVRQLSRVVGAPVSDQTGLTGQYDMELKFTPEMPAGPAPEGRAGSPGGEAPSIFTALQEQLGLKLEAKKAPANMLVIDKIEKPEEN